MNTESKPIIIKCDAHRITYICPKCKKPIIFRKRYQGRSLCIQCGQRLDWEPLNNLSFESIIAYDSDAAAWIADRYYTTCKTPESERLDTDDWRKSLKYNNIDLYLIFTDKKVHGSFMRQYAKEFSKE